jgi:hypothetical protein
MVAIDDCVTALEVQGPIRAIYGLVDMPGALLVRTDRRGIPRLVHRRALNGQPASVKRIRCDWGLPPTSTGY